MAALALALGLLFVLIVFVIQPLLLRRRTGSSGCSVALGMLVPTVLTPAVVGSCVIALQIQTRLVEEPHLRRVHGMSYQSYAAHVGRFLPALGRLRRVPPGAGQVS